MQTNLIYTLIIFLRVLYVALFARIILTWLPIGENPLTNLLHFITDPLMNPIRGLLKKSILVSNSSGLDLTPLFALVILNGVELSLTYFM